MIEIRKPYYGAMSERLLSDAFEKNGRYYVVDVAKKVFETTKEDYEKSLRLLAR